MRRPLLVALFIVVVGALGTGCGGTDEDASGPSEPIPAGSPGEAPDEGQGPADGFVGLTLDEASRRAEEQGRPWRISRQDDEVFGLTGDLVPGRVTFEVDEGVVTAALIEGEEEPLLEPPPAVSGDAERAELVAAAVARLVTDDNSFGGEDVFERVEVAELVGSDESRRLGPLTRELIAVAVQPTARVVFVPDANAAIDGYFAEMVQGIAVVSVDDVRIRGETAEVEMRLWCGSLCGVFLTYEAQLTDTGWEILGPIGPIAVS